jgi:hypothetical protein
MSDEQQEIYRNVHRELIRELQEITKLAFTLSLTSQPKPGYETAWAEAIEKLEGRDL